MGSRNKEMDLEKQRKTYLKKIVVEVGKGSTMNDGELLNLKEGNVGKVGL